MCTEAYSHARSQTHICAQQKVCTTLYDVGLIFSVLHGMLPNITVTEIGVCQGKPVDWIS